MNVCQTTPFLFTRLVRTIAIANVMALANMIAAAQGTAEKPPTSGDVANGQSARQAETSTVAQAQAPTMRQPVQILKMHEPGTAAVTPTFSIPGAFATYFGGPIITNVHVVQVLYGSGSYVPGVQATTTPSVASFFADITQSSYFDMLAEYSTAGITAADGTPGTNQTLGHGSFDGQITITPSAANNGTTITDSQIQAELLAQVTAGKLPAPVIDAQGNNSTLYMLYFPAGKAILLGSTPSCQSGGFCAYHNSTSALFGGRNLFYGVMPDVQPPSGCSRGCGVGNPLDIVTNVTSHELSEAVTDANVGPATAFARPLAWVDPINGEIGDICLGQETSILANGTTYTVQQEFSNLQNDCVGGPLQFHMTAGPDVGAGTQFDIAMAVENNAGTSILTGYTGTVHFTSSDPAAVLPPDYKFSFADGGRHHFVATLKTSGQQTITAADTVLKGTNSPVTLGVNVPNVSQFSLASPAVATIGVPATVVVSALDPSAVLQPNYNGKVHFTSTDAGAVLPPDTNLVNGTGTFTVTFNNAAIQMLQVADALTPSISKSNPVTVAAASANPTTTTVSANVNPSTFGQSLLITMTVVAGANPNVGGTMSMTVDGFPFVSGGIFGSSTASLPASGGTHTVYANYFGDATNGSSSSAPLTITVNPAASTTVLTSSASSAAFGTPVTLSTQITPAGPFPRGTVTFLDGANPIAVIPASQTFSPGFTISSLPVGSHSISASFSGSPDFLASTSAPITQVITPASPPDYTVTANTNAATLSAGQTAIFVITTQSLNGFTGDVRFTCANLPALTSCTFSPPQAVVGSTLTNVITTLTVKTTGPHAQLLPSNLPGPDHPLYAAAWGTISFAVCILLLAACPKKSRRALAMTSMVLLLAAAVVSCGGGGSTPPPTPTSTPPPTTPAGTTAFKVSAAGVATAGANPANPTQQLNLSITVQP